MPTDHNGDEIRFCPNTGFGLLGFSSDGYAMYLHRDTGTAFNADGYDIDGFNGDGISERGFRRNRRHSQTGTLFHPVDHLTWDGTVYDVYSGCDYLGRSRCDNGECTDSYCDTCHPPDTDDDSLSFDEKLDSYNCNVIRRHGWRDKSTPDNVDRTLYAGHEFEMFSDDVDYDDVAFTLAQIDNEYRRHSPQTRTRKCCIAKHDGSLQDYKFGGFETVTVPLSRDQTYGIFKAFDVLGGQACSAWTVGKAVGHHIHLSRQAIGPLTLGKMLVFLNAEANKGFLVAMAGRNCEDYAAFSTSKKLTDADRGDRYEVLNVTNTTAEFRLFRSNLYTRAILKNYEFAISTVRFCEAASHGLGEVEDKSSPLHYYNYRRFVADHHIEYPFLHQFLLTNERLGLMYRKHGVRKRNTIPSERSTKFRFVQRNPTL
jgi:hypothetical protein